jgi:hypothetical protein
MLQDLIAALHAAVREFRRRRWAKQRVRQVTLPF